METKGRGQNSSGIVYLVGAGPGDPGLITVKALEKIKMADVIIYDYLAGKQFTNAARQDAEIIYVGKTGSNHTLEQPDINSLIVSKAQDGKTVVRLKGGDPYLFGRGGEEAEELVAAGINFEVIPGVTSGIAAPAYAGIPVTHREYSSMVTFVTGHEDPSKEESALDWHLLARSPGTLVFLMGIKNLSNISRALIQHGMKPETPSAVVMWGTTPDQKSVFSSLESLPFEATKAGIKAPAVVVVGPVAALGRQLAWFENKALFGKKVMITRSREQSRKLAERILELGGQPILFPTISIVDALDFKPIDDSINRIHEYQWVVFTSVNGVEKFLERFQLIAQDIREMRGPKIAAIGPATAAALRQRGLKVDVTAEEFLAEGLIKAFDKIEIAGTRFLIPRAEKARDILPEKLAAAGAWVETVAAYRTEKPKDNDVESVVQSLTDGFVDAITFTSSSTVAHFVEIIERNRATDLLSGVTVASIGPITSATARHLGIQVHVEAAQYTIEGLVAALVGHFGR
ncbi:MAG: uroporphyrinogen methyltransferase / synthase [Thermodesulfobacteriota bacterium]|nr:uroporphyrinogen methyltransferase / synthase [Thermodesulfobacteriota bacterium]